MTPRFLLLVVVLIAGFFVGSISDSVGQEGYFESVASTGETASDGQSKFLTFGSAGINHQGAVLYSADLNDSPNGSNDDFLIERWAGGSRVEVMRKGSAAVDGNGVFDSFGAVFNDQGQVLLDTQYSGTDGTGNAGVNFFDGTDLLQISRSDDNEPNRPTTITGYGSLRLNNDGLFSIELFNNQGTQSLLTHGGSQAPRYVVTSDGTQASPDGNGTFVGFASSRLNDAGNSAFVGELSGTAGGSDDDSGIFLDKNQTLFQIARKGDMVGTNVLTGFSDVGLSEFGLVAFAADLNGTTDQGLFVANENNVQRFVERGMTAAGGNGNYDQFEFSAEHGINRIGRIAYSATLSGTSGGATDDEGIFRSSINGTRLVIQKGENQSGLGTITGFGDVRINDASAVVFEAFSNGNKGIAVGDDTETVFVAAEGDTFNGITLDSIELEGFNNWGQVLFKGTDTSTGDETLQTWTPDLKWRIDGDGFWSDANRWTLGIQPDQVHRVEIAPASQSTVFGPSSETTVKSLIVGDGTVDVLFDLQPQGTLTVTDFVDIFDEAQLGGNGTIETPVMNLLGELTPDGVVNVMGELNFADSAVFTIDVANDLDQLIVVGDVVLAGELNVNFLSDELFSGGALLTIVDVTGSRTGEFSGIAENSLLGTFNDYQVFLTYLGGDGNDVALRIAVPEPGVSFVAILLLLGYCRRNTKSRMN